MKIGKIELKDSFILDSISSGLLKVVANTIASAVANSDYTPAVMLAEGDLIIGGTLGVAKRLGVGTANHVIHGGIDPTYGPIVEADIVLATNTTNNVSTVRHGFVPILPNSPTLFFNGQGNYTTVTSGAASGYIAQSFTGTTATLVHNLNGYPCVAVIDNTGALIIPDSITYTSVNEISIDVTSLGSMTGIIIANLGSPGIPNLSTQAGDYSVQAGDNTILVNATATITLPTAVGITGRQYTIKRIFVGGNTTIATTSSQTIDGQTTVILGSVYNSITVVSDGNNWFII